MTGKFELKKTEAGKFVFNLTAGNGHVILTSPLYESLEEAERGIAVLRASVADKTEIERRQAVNGEPHNDAKLNNVTRRFKYYGAFVNDPGALELFDEIERERDQRVIGG